MSPTLVGALLAGLATSLHCAGMCGPLACGATALARSNEERLAATAAYHACRLAAYTAIGAACGGLGELPLRSFFASPAVLLPWALVIALLLLATGLERKIPRPAPLQRWAARIRFKLRGLPPIGAGAALGLLTPLLPCGPLYAMFLALIAAGSAARGAETALIFGIGTVPLLWLSQHQFQRLRDRLSPRTWQRCQRGLALVAALVLAWRLHDTLPQRTPLAEEHRELPSCCH